MLLCQETYKNICQTNQGNSGPQIQKDYCGAYCISLVMTTSLQKPLLLDVLTDFQSVKLLFSVGFLEPHVFECVSGLLSKLFF